jgi:2-oxo-3-hexenedioate decarboxylase
MLDEATCVKLARQLDDARHARREVEPLLQSFGPFDMEDAYRIQRAGIGLRVAQGEAVAGYKMGLTSQAKRDQMNLLMPVYGVLTDAMRIPAEAAFHVARGIHPRAEPEIAFVTGRPLRGKVSQDEALEAVTSVCAALEILDSRYRGFRYFSLFDVVADNSSSSHFVLADDARAPWGLKLDKLEMRMLIDGKVVQQAESSAISGNPIVSLQQLAEMLDAHGQEVPANTLVLTGAATPAQPLAAGQTVTLEVTGLAPVTLRCE